MPSAVVEGVLESAGVEPADTSGITVENGCLCFKGRVVADAKIETVSCHEQGDGTHLMAIRITRADGGGMYTSMLAGDVLENQQKVNALGTMVARAAFSFSSRDGSLAALKLFLQSQPGNHNVIVDVNVAGWNERYNCFFGENGVIDAYGEFHPWRNGSVTAATRDGRKTSPGKHTFSMRKEKFGTDLPLVEPPKGRGQAAYFLAGDVLKTNNGVEMPRPMSLGDLAPDHALDVDMVAARAHVMDTIALWKRNTGDYAGAGAIGYMASCNVRHFLTSSERNFPHLYITGRWSHGKDTLAEVLALATGMPTNNVISAGKSTTEKLIRNKLAMVGNMPLWVNELRNENADTLLTQIRTSYDLQGNGVTNIKQEQVLFPVHRPFLLVGEVQVGRDAEASRYVSISLQRPPADKAVLPSLKRAASAMASHWSTFMRDHNRGAWQIAQCVEKLKPIFLENGCDSRRARGWAIAAAGLAYLLDPDCHLDPRASIPPEMFSDVLHRAAESMIAAAEEGVGGQFWNLMQSLKAVGELSNSGSSRWAKSVHQTKDRGTEKIAIWTPHLFRLLAKSDRGMNKGLVINELKSDPGYDGMTNVRMANESRNCFMLRAASCRLPEWVLAAARQVDTDGNDESCDEQEMPTAAVPSDVF